MADQNAAQNAALAEPPVRRGSGGRPTREEAVRRDERLIEVATALFMERGFDGTSIDAVAETAGVSKPTVYARYKDKRELFAAVLRQRIATWLAPLSAAAEAQANSTAPKDVRTALYDLSREMIRCSVVPGAMALKRILVAQAVDFPELAKLAHEEGRLRGVRAIATLLQSFADRGELTIDDPELAAEMFLNLVLGHESRMALYGITTDPAEQERRTRAAVDLFLDGVRPRPEK